MSSKRFETKLGRIAVRFPVGTFLCITGIYSMFVAGLIRFAGSNGSGLVVVPYAWAPLIGAGTTVWLRGDGIRSWFGQVANWRVGIHWYLIGIGTVILATDFRNVVAFLFRMDVSVQAGAEVPITQYLFFFAVTLFLAGALEEFGWRGFMQPHLQRRYSALTASVAVGTAWTLWHVPLMVSGVGGISRPFPEYLVVTVATSILLAWLYNSTDGSLPVVMVTHAASNMTTILVVNGELTGLLESFPWDVLFHVLLVIGIVMYAGPTTLSRGGTPPQPPDGRESIDGTAGESLEGYGAE